MVRHSALQKITSETPEAEEMARIFDELPQSVRADVLCMVKALHEKYGFPELSSEEG